MTRPVHKHHCGSCSFLGTIDSKKSSRVPPDAKQVDLYGCDYVHRDTDGNRVMMVTDLPYYFVGARWGSDVKEVLQADFFNLKGDPRDSNEPHLAEAMRRYAIYDNRGDWL